MVLEGIAPGNTWGAGGKDHAGMRDQTADSCMQRMCLNLLSYLLGLSIFLKIHSLIFIPKPKIINEYV